jgi:cohesin loading factor subunit SCC2
MCTISKLRDRQLVEDLLHAIVAPKPGKNIAVIQTRYSAMNDVFIDSLVDGSDQPEQVSCQTAEMIFCQFFFQSVGHCVKAIYAFTSANPSIISSSKASMLLPYLKSAQTVGGLGLLASDHKYVGYITG